MHRMIKWIRSWFIAPSPEEMLSQYLTIAKRELINTEFEKDFVDHKVIQLRSRIARLSSELKRIAEETNK